MINSRKKNWISLVSLWNIYLSIKQFQNCNCSSEILENSLQECQDHHQSSVSLYPTHMKEKLCAIHLHFFVGSDCTLHWGEISEKLHATDTELLCIYFNYTDCGFCEWVTQYPTQLLLCQQLAQIMRHLQNAVKEAFPLLTLTNGTSSWKLTLQFLSVSGVLLNVSSLPWELRSPWG